VVQILLVTNNTVHQRCGDWTTYFPACTRWNS